MDCCKDHKEHKGDGVKKGFTWWWCLLLIPVGLIVIYVFKIPIGSLLPWGVFLLCPLMHVFMMKGHGGHEGHEEHKEEKPKE